MKNWMIFFLCLILCGCDSPAPEKTVPRAVVSVQVTLRENDVVTRREYTDPRETEAVVSAVRSLKPVGANPPVSVFEPGMYLTFLCADGSVTRLTLSGNYLSRNWGPWQALSPQSVRELILLIRMLDHSFQNGSVQSLHLPALD